MLSLILYIFFWFKTSIRHCFYFYFNIISKDPIFVDISSFAVNKVSSKILIFKFLFFSNNLSRVLLETMERRVFKRLIYVQNANEYPCVIRLPTIFELPEEEFMTCETSSDNSLSESPCWYTNFPLYVDNVVIEVDAFKDTLEIDGSDISKDDSINNVNEFRLNLNHHQMTLVTFYILFSFRFSVIFIRRCLPYRNIYSLLL